MFSCCCCCDCQFVYRFGGIPRKEFVTISSSSSPDGQLDLKKSMDALTLALNPIYSNLSMEHSVGNSTIILTNVRSFSLSLSNNFTWFSHKQKIIWLSNEGVNYFSDAVFFLSFLADWFLRKTICPNNTKTWHKSSCWQELGILGFAIPFYMFNNVGIWVQTQFLICTSNWLGYWSTPLQQAHAYGLLQRRWWYWLSRCTKGAREASSRSSQSHWCDTYWSHRRVCKLGIFSSTLLLFTWGKYKCTNDSKQHVKCHNPPG